MENQKGRKIKCLKSDNGIEYIDSRLTKLCKEHGIKRHFTIRKTPQHNSVAERMNRSIVERARCIRLNARIEKKLWAEAVSMACYLINRSLRAVLDGKVVEEVWTGNEVDYSRLRVFGCPTYAHIAERRGRNLMLSLNNAFFGISERGKRLEVVGSKG